MTSTVLDQTHGQTRTEDLFRTIWPFIRRAIAAPKTSCRSKVGQLTTNGNVGGYK
jgi:hypothetical protein